jgi:hypothetical protein
MARYPDYDNVEGRPGGPYLDELEVLAHEKRCAAAEGRLPDYLSLITSEGTGFTYSLGESDEFDLQKSKVPVEESVLSINKDSE